MQKAERRIFTALEADGELTVAPEAELRVASSGELEGYAVVFDKLSHPMGGFVERVARGAVELASDVVATFNHNLAQLLGRTGSGTLSVTVDEVGVRYQVKLPKTTAGADVRELVRRGDVFGSSFTFQTIEQAWTKLKGTDLRTLLKIKVSELGPVSFPAYPDTTAAVRALAELGGGSPSTSASSAALRHLRRRQDLAELLTGD
jgi:HK97 family phage prohead protease